MAKCTLVMTLRDSLNQKVLDAGVQTRSGCKWSAMTAVDHAGSMLEIDILSNTCTGRKGIGVAYFHQRVTRRKERAWCKERWINRLKKSEDERLQNSAIREPGYDGSFQKAKIRGRSYGTRTNTELCFRYDQCTIPYHHQSTMGIYWRSCLQAVWKKDTIAYDLSGCSVALTQIQYKWKDDKNVRELADVVKEKWRKKSGCI